MGRGYACPPSTAYQLAREVAQQTGQALEQVDATAHWLAVRPKLAAPGVAATTQPCEDGHLRGLAIF